MRKKQVMKAIVFLTLGTMMWGGLVQEGWAISSSAGSRGGLSAPPGQKINPGGGSGKLSNNNNQKPSNNAGVGDYGIGTSGGNTLNPKLKSESPRETHMQEYCEENCSAEEYFTKLPSNSKPAIPDSKNCMIKRSVSCVVTVNWFKNQSIEVKKPGKTIGEINKAYNYLIQYIVKLEKRYEDLTPNNYRKYGILNGSEFYKEKIRLKNAIIDLLKVCKNYRKECPIPKSQSTNPDFKTNGL